VDVINFPRPWFRISFYYVYLPFVVLGYTFQLVTAAGLSRGKTWARIATTYCLRIYLAVLLLVAALFMAGAAVFAARGEWGGSVALATQALGSITGAALVGWISRRAV